MSRIDRRRFSAVAAAGFATAVLPRRARPQPARPTIRFGGTLSDDMTPVVYDPKAVFAGFVVASAPRRNGRDDGRLHRRPVPRHSEDGPFARRPEGGAALIQPMIDLAAKSGVITAAYPASELIDPNVR
jgi:hypothetical protein